MNDKPRWSFQPNVGRVDKTPMVNLSRLPPDEKRQAWEHIKANRPALAELLQDETVAELKALFGAEIYVEKSDAGT